jgi:hypothetical protein
MRNRRDPSWRPTSGEGGPYKPTAKEDRAGRESEGFIVPMTPVTKTPAEGRDPALVMAVYGGKREGMVARPKHPLRKCENSNTTFSRWPSATGRASGTCCGGSGGVTFRQRRDRIALVLPEACMLREKTIGKPYAGNLHVRFERGPQETEPACHRA